MRIDPALFKRVVTSSKSGFWDEVAVTQIGSLTSPYLPACYGRLRCSPACNRYPGFCALSSHHRGHLYETSLRRASSQILSLSLSLGFNPSFFYLPADDTRIFARFSRELEQQRNNEPIKLKVIRENLKSNFEDQCNIILFVPYVFNSLIKKNV